MAFSLDPKLAGFLGNAAQDIGYGLSNAPTFATGIGKSVARGQEQEPYRNAYAIQEKAAADKQAAMQAQAELRSKYSSFFAQQGENDYARAVADGIIEPGDAYRDWMSKKAGGGGPAPTADMQNYEYGLKNPGFVDFQTQRGGAAETSLQPTWGIDSDPNSPTYNKPVLGQLNKAGQFVKTELPSGVQPLGPYDLNANKAAGTMFGKQTGDAQFDVPSAKLTVDQTVDALKEIRDNEAGMNEQFGNILGLPTQMIPARPGTAMADFRNSVSRGANLAFMQAREMLRGGGQITDFESKKAESAITDMQIAMESGGKQMFIKAMDDFERAVKDGFAKLQSQASAIPGYGAGQSPAGGDVLSQADALLNSGKY